jgi:hypothetical protein
VPGRSTQSLAISQMGDALELTVWGVAVGTILALVANGHIRGERRRQVVKWCLAFGAVSVAVFVVVAALGITLVPTRAVLGMGFVGFPALFGGLILLVFGAVARDQSGKGRATDG